MEVLHHGYGVPRRGSRFASNSMTDLTKPEPVSKLIILQARFQQKQLQEKEEKLLKLYEEQQERAMNRVGGRVQSGGSSVSSTSSVGRGKVRHMFQSRRGTSEWRQGRDRSYPLDPIVPKQNLPIRTQSLDAKKSPWTRSRIEANNNSRNTFEDSYEDEPYFREEEESRRVRRTQSQVRVQKPKSKLLYFGGSHTDLRFSDELDYVQTFHVIDDHYEIPGGDLIRRKDSKEDDYFVNEFDSKRRFYENRLSECGPDVPCGKLPNVGMNRGQKKPENAESGRYKTYVSHKPFVEKPHLGRKPSAEVAQAKEPQQQKVRRATPMPATVAPKPSLLQTGRTNVPVRQTGKREGTPPVPASRTTVARTPSEKPPIAKKTPRPAKPTSDLPGCQICGRHFAEDRIAKHQEICKKSSKSKRKPFDSVKQRVKGTEAEQFLKGGKLRNQQQKPVKPPQKDWRKTHEDFINSIRAAREYQISTNQNRKPSNMRASSTGGVRR